MILLYLGEAVSELALVADDGRHERAVLRWVLAARAQAVEAPCGLEVVSAILRSV